MTPRFGAIPRFCITLLLVLVVSPVTAPFSTCNPGVLFHDSGPLGGAVMHAKPPSDDAPVGMVGSPDVQYVRDAAPAHVADLVSPPHTRLTVDLPLRI